MKIAFLAAVTLISMSSMAQTSNKIFCQSQMAKAADDAVVAQASKAAPGKKIEAFESSTSGADGWLNGDYSEKETGIAGLGALSIGSVEGTVYTGGFLPGGIGRKFKGTIYMKSGTCEVVKADIKIESGSAMVLE